MIKVIDNYCIDHGLTYDWYNMRQELIKEENILKAYVYKDGTNNNILAVTFYDEGGREREVTYYEVFPPIIHVSMLIEQLYDIKRKPAVDGLFNEKVGQKSYGGK